MQTQLQHEPDIEEHFVRIGLTKSANWAL
jgi:hypothetical protein